MAKPKDSSGPEFVRLFAPMLDTLRDLGNSGRPKEVSAKIAERLNVPATELDRVNKNGLSRFDNQVAWARFYLAHDGLIDTSRRGVWTLTEAGRQTRLDHQSALILSQRVQRKLKDAGTVTDITSLHPRVSWGDVQSRRSRNISRHKHF